MNRSTSAVALALAALLVAGPVAYAVDFVPAPVRLDDDEKKKTVIAEKDVPAKVLEGLKKAYPNATIGKVEKETYKSGEVHYEFEIKTADGKIKEVELNADGEVLDEDH